MRPTNIFHAELVLSYRFALGTIGPNAAAFASAQGAAYQIFKTIDRVPTIDSSNPGGAKPENVTGHIVVTDVDFHYPSRPDVPILKKMNIEVKPGQTVALVGHSGSGKSTIVGLVERFYDPICKSFFHILFACFSCLRPCVLDITLLIISFVVLDSWNDYYGRS